MLNKNFLSLFFTFVFFSFSAFSSTTAWHENESGGAKVRLISTFYQDNSNQRQLIAGIHFKIKKGWKVYGADSASIGMPPSFDFTKSKNFKSFIVIWPQAISKTEKIGDETIKYSVYENEVILPIEIQIADKEQETQINLKLDYGLCSDICVPASEEISLLLDNKTDNEVLDLIQNFYPKELPKSNKTESKSLNKNNNLISIIFLAIIGGAILNIMPCVLPVLSIKILSIIEHSNAKKKRIKFAFFATCLGIISCFVILASIAVFLKITGKSLGWGLQFQNPYFLIFLILVLIFFIANLLGLFEITFSNFIANIVNKKISNPHKKKNIFIPNFLSGVLAVLLATPCSAPFLGTAISFALSAEIIEIFTVFLAIGFGFALPYIILFFTPSALKFLPKPGKWMYLVKKFMALFLVATILWLIFILNHNIGIKSAIITAISAILILAAFVIKNKTIKTFVIAILTITTFLLSEIYQQNNLNFKKSETKNVWIDFDKSLIQKAVSQGKVVVIDITADWCLTCKLNKKLVLENSEVLAKLSENNIIAMRGNITKPNQEISDFLRSHNRFAIPFNAIYGPNAQNGIVTKELLNKEEFLSLINKAQ